MPKSILKKDIVNFNKVDLEDFSPPVPSLISSESVREVDSGEVQQPSTRKKTIISSNDVRFRAERVEICIQDFSNPEPLIAPEQTYNGLPPEEDDEEESAIGLEQIEALKETWNQEWQIKLDEAVEEAQKAGFKEGQEKAREELKKEHAELKESFSLNLKLLQETWDNYIKRSETILLKIALEITQFIVDIPLPGHYTDITERVLNETLDKLSRDTPLTLSLNPLDLLRMQESGVMELIKEQFSGLRWDPQPTLKEGNWIIQTPRQAIRRITDELLDNLKNQFGLVDQTHETEISSTLPGYDIEYIPPVTNVAVSTTQIPVQIKEKDLQNVAFTAATSTATASLQDTKDIQNISNQGA